MPVHNRLVTGPDGSINPGGLVNLGAFFPVEIKVPDALAESLTQAGRAVPAPLSGMALIDTGATRTCIHEPLLQQLGLNPIGIAETGTAGGQTRRNVYQAKLEVQGEQWSFAPPGVIGVDLTGQRVALLPNPEPIVALLGRDFLQTGLFVWNGKGGFWSMAI